VAEAAQVELKESGQIKDSAERRTELAADRNVFAARTDLCRLGAHRLAALASGVGAKAALKDVIPEYIVVPAGTVLALFSAFFFAGIWREFFSAGPPPPQPDIKVLPRLVLIGVNSFLILVALAAVFGIWFGRTGGR
jgi:putative membrane protein